MEYIYKILIAVVMYAIGRYIAKKFAPENNFLIGWIFGSLTMFVLEVLP